MSEDGDISEGLASHPETYNEQHEHVGVQNIAIVGNNKLHITTPELNTDQFFVATSRGVFPAEQLTNGSGHSLKNCIIIQDQSAFETLTLSTANNSIRTINVGSNPLIASAQVEERSRARTPKYNWDESVHDTVLPVRCKDTNGELHKKKFGSGKVKLLL